MDRDMVQVVYMTRYTDGSYRYIVMTTEQDSKQAHLIELGEWAQAQGCTEEAARKRCQRGGVPGAIKYGRKWLVPEDATWEDDRRR